MRPSFIQHSRIGLLRSLVPLLCLAMLWLPTAAGGGQDSGGSGEFSVTFENDCFGGSDKYYTSGVKLSYLSGDVAGDATSPDAHVLDRLAGMMPPFLDDSGLKRGFSLSLGQTIYTPGDKEAGELDDNDRPYAGWTYASLGFHAWTPTRLDTLEIALGAVGPASLAEETYGAVHVCTGHGEPDDWEDRRIENEPGVALGWWRTWKTGSGVPRDGKGGWAWDALPRVGAVVGNVGTYATAGCAFRAGQNLPEDFGQRSLDPIGGFGVPGAGASPRPGDGFGWWLFAGADGYGVARNIFLDGNTVRDSPSTDKEPFVADIYGGIGLDWNGLKLTWTQAYRTPEFTSQAHGQFLGSITLTLTF